MHPLSPQRRLILKGGLAAGSLFLPVPYAWVWAQSEGMLKLLQAPKLALVLGNSNYKEGPLRNPANDAKAIGDVLKASGFDVTLKVDVNRAEMAAAVQAYVQAVAARKGVGLFYYAGHGVQLAWRNYMLPVDMAIDTLADIPKQGVEVNSLLEGLTKAANPMNLIILDACRDNPFGSLKGMDQKGLSQMDAPNSTLLAYATSPGNVASDGEGSNGLYTENLLRELKIPEAKIEDVFKRVRLAVRRKSNGQQVPWESTSLEEDFYFIPPKRQLAPSEEEKEKQFDDELAQWKKVRASGEAAPLEDFLRRYPSGNFAELAQLQLDEMLARQGENRILIASSAGNPFTQGFARADMNFQAGDTYTYRELDLESNAEKRTFTTRVASVRDAEVVFVGGLILDRLGNTLALPDGRRFSPRQDQPLEYALGKKWNTRFTVTPANGQRADNEFEFRIVRRETIAVPAGRFDCFVIEGNGNGVTETGVKVALRYTRWMAPDKVRRPIATEQFRKVTVQLGTGKAGGFGARLGPGMSDGQAGLAGKGGPGMSDAQGGFASKGGQSGFAGKGGPGGFAGKGEPGGGGGGAARTIERILDSDRQELVAYKQS